MTPLNRQDAFEALKSLDQMQVYCEVRDDCHHVGFSYMSWSVYKKKCFQHLRERYRLRRNMSKARRAEIARVVGAFAGSRQNYECRTRKVCFARLMAELSKTWPDGDLAKFELIAGVVLSRGRRSEYAVHGTVSFNSAWDTETLVEFLKFRRHDMPALRIANRADIETHIMRHLGAMDLPCRRKVTRYVLQRRHFCRYYENPAALRAIDCSFKYTGSAYAFEKVVDYKNFIDLAMVIPEVFFKKAGQKARERKFAGWIREQKDHFEDIHHSLYDLADPNAEFKSWSELERYSRDWHARRIIGVTAAGESQPLDIKADIPRVFEKDGYLFTLLASIAEIVEEGRFMRHCISGYVGEVRQGRYLAYKVEGHGERATAGLRLKMARRQPVWSLDQARGKHNGPVSLHLVETCRGLAASLHNGKLPVAA